MREFKVNEFLSLRLEDDQTIIYIQGQLFRQCRFLLLNINVDEMGTFDEIDSIDEAAEKLNTSLENPDEAYKFDIPPEVEFWGHCSNLQVWFEHNYDTRLLHSNLAFPLLRKLTKAEDPLAKKVFRKEILKRYENGTKATREFLEVERFYEYLTIDEQLHVLLNDNDFGALIELYEVIFPLIHGDANIDYMEDYLLLNMIGNGDIKIKDRQITELNLRNLGMREFPKSILKFKALEVLILRNNRLKKLPQDIGELTNLRELYLNNSKIVNLPDSFCNLKNLEIVSLGTNFLEHLPNNIGFLTKLKILHLSANFLKKVPKSICELRNLETLSLSNNRLENLPRCFSELISIKYLSLEGNSFKEYPEVLKNLSDSKNIKIDF